MTGPRDEIRKATRAYSEKHPVLASDDAGAGGMAHPRATRRPFAWWTLLVLIGLGAGGWYLARGLQADAKMQDCIMSGRKNCAPIEEAR